MGEEANAIIIRNEKNISAVMVALNAAHGLELVHPTQRRMYH